MNKDTIIRTIVLALALINQCLVMAGISPLPIDDATLTNVVTGIFTIAAALWVWWKDNAITKEAKVSNQIMKELKAGNVALNDAENLINKTK